MNDKLFPEGPEVAARNMADALTGMADRGAGMQKLATLKALQDIVTSVQNKRHYTYVRTACPGYYDFYLNGKLRSTMRMVSPDMADYVLEILEGGFTDGVTFTATETFKTLKS